MRYGLAMLRFFLLRFLPRRIVPFLIALDVIRMIRGWRARNRPPIATTARRRGRVVEVRDPVSPAVDVPTDRTV